MRQHGLGEPAPKPVDEGVTTGSKACPEESSGVQRSWATDDQTKISSRARASADLEG